MKYYKLTVIKDFPGHKKGEIFSGISERVYNDTISSWVRDDVNLSEIVYYAKEYPDFVKTDLDYLYAVDTSCPLCHSTVAFPYVQSEQFCKDDEKYVNMSFGFECAVCGKRHYITEYEHHVY